MSREEKEREQKIEVDENFSIIRLKILCSIVNRWLLGIRSSFAIDLLK